MSKLKKIEHNNKIYTIRAWFHDNEYSKYRDVLTFKKLPEVKGLKSVRFIEYNGNKVKYNKYNGRLVILCESGEAIHSIVNILQIHSKLIEILGDDDEFYTCSTMGEAA